MKVAVGLSYFDSAKELPRCLGKLTDKNALCNNVDYIIAIDGKYDGYNAKHNYSNDGSTEILSKYPNVVQSKFYGYQTKKRQKYLDIAGQLGCDWLIVVDADEYLHPEHQDWKKFYTNLITISRKYPEHKLFKLQIWLDKNWERAWNMVRRNRFQNYVRIHKDPASQRYACHTHYYWSNKDITDKMLITGKGLMLNAYDKPIDGIRLAIDSKLRSEETLWLRDRWAWDTTHEEQRRIYILKGKYIYKQKDIPTDINVFHHYDDVGRPIVNNKSKNTKDVWKTKSLKSLVA